MAMPTPSGDPVAGATADAPDPTGDLAEPPKPLQTSPTALRSDARPAPALLLEPLGATELAKTDWPPRLVTPAVAPLARAANRPDGLLAVDGAAALPEPTRPLPAWAPALPVPWVAPLVLRPPPVARVDAPLDPLVVPVVLEGVDPAELLGAGAAAGPGAAALPVVAEAPLLPLGWGEGGGVLGVEAGGVWGTPTSGPVQAKAKLAPTTAIESTPSTVSDNCRVLLFIALPQTAQSLSCRRNNSSRRA
jgi:hypothetical protein